MNVSHLIPLELYSELNDPNLYVHQVDEQEEITSGSDIDDISNINATLPDNASARPSHRTALASREQISTLATEGRL